MVFEGLLGILSVQFSTQTLEELEGYFECVVERDWKKGNIKISRPAMADTLLMRFGAKHSSNISTLPVVEVGPTMYDDVVHGRPFRKAVGGVMLLASVTRPDIANAARPVDRHSHSSCERHWVVVETIVANLNATRDLGITYERGSRLPLAIFVDTDYAKEVTGRFPVSGVAVMLGGDPVCSINRIQNCVAVSTTEGEYVAMSGGVQEGLFGRSILSFIH